MKNLTSSEWWKAAGIRAIKTFCQTFIVMAGSAITLEEVSWKFALSASALAALLSLLTSLAGLPEVTE